LPFLSIGRKDKQKSELQDDTISFMAKPRIYLYLFLLLIPVVVFLFVFSFFGLNIPFEDDIGILHSLMIDLPNAKTFHDKFFIFFIPQNEHPVAIYKFFIWAYYVVFANIHIKYITLIGNLVFLSSLGFFFRQLQLIKVSWVWLIPIPYFLFSLYSHENALWALCTFQHTVIISLYLWGLYFTIAFREASYKFYIGVFLLACTCVCSGNGFLGFAIAFVILLLEKRGKSALIIGAILALIKFTLLNNQYFHQPNPIKQIVISFLMLCGAIVKVSSKQSIIIGLGGVLIICISLFFVYTIFGKLKKEERLYYLLATGLCLFGFGTFLGLAVFRDIASSAFPDRYRVYTHLLWIGLYLFSVPFLVRITFQQYIYRFMVLLGIGYFAYSFVNVIPNLLFQFHQRMLISVNYYAANTTLSGCFYRGYFDETLRNLAERKIYQLPRPTFDSKSFSRGNPTPLTVTNPDSDTFYLSSNEGSRSGNPKENALFVMLKDSSNNAPLLIPVLQDHNSLRSVLLPGYQFSKGFQTIFSKTCFPDGNYSIQIAKLENNKLLVSDTQYLFDSKSFKISSHK